MAAATASTPTALSPGGMAPGGNSAAEDRTLIFNLMKAWVELYMSGDRFDASHDFAHVERVLANARHILSVERSRAGAPTYDGFIIDLAALLHDVDDRKYRDYSTSHVRKMSFAYPTSAKTGGWPSTAAVLGAGAGSAPAIDEDDDGVPMTPLDERAPAFDEGIRDTIKVALLNAGAEERVAHAVQMICAHVSFTVESRDPDAVRAMTRQFPELAIVQDADRLDALGAVGVARTFAYTGAMSARGLQNKRTLVQTLGHFHEKLERLEGLMKTAEGRKMAAERTGRLMEFRKWFEQESGDVL